MMVKPRGLFFSLISPAMGSMSLDSERTKSTGTCLLLASENTMLGKSSAYIERRACLVPGCGFPSQDVKKFKPKPGALFSEFARIDGGLIRYALAFCGKPIEETPLAVYDDGQ